MTPTRMLVKHDPSAGTYGDCFRCCVAALLDLPAETVPHVFREYAETGDAGHAEMAAWLASRGLRLIWVPFIGEVSLDQVLTSVEANNPGLAFLVGGFSRPGCGHFVVAQGGRIACDPAPGQAGLCGPHDDGLWHLYFMGRLDG